MQAFLPLYCTFFIVYQYEKTGAWPQMLQGQNWLYRKGNYGVQHTHNANPDNFFDRRYYCWTSDPACGLDQAPKRPLEDLHDPSKLAKFQRDAATSERLARTGFQGF